MPASGVKQTLPGPAPRQDAWKIIGPGGGGTMIGPTISPHDPSLVLEHCDMTGSYITTDGALSWRMINFGSVVSVFAYDPNNADVIYAGSYALWRSEDRGKTWRMRLPDPAKNTIVHMQGDHADAFLTSDDPQFPGGQWRISAIAVDPSDSNRVCVVFVGRGLIGVPARLYVSGDRGRTWKCEHEFSPMYVVALHVGPAEGAIYLVTDSGVHTCAGGSWKHRISPGGLPIRAATVGVADGASEPTIYATTDTFWRGTQLEGGIYASDDGGQTWRRCTGWVTDLFQNPGEGRAPQFRAIACSQMNPEAVYVGFRGLRLAEDADKNVRAEVVTSAGVIGTQHEGWYNGIAKSTDGGGTWTIVHKESTSPSDNLDASWIEERARDGGRNIWFDTPYSLGVAPSDPGVCYATDLFRTYRTLDGGKTWQQANSVRVGEDHWTTRGLDVTTCYGVHFDPFDVKHMFITYTDIGMFQSSDGGASWIGSTQGIPMQWRNTTYWIEFDPAVKGLVWGVFSGPHDLPRPKMWRERGVGRYSGGVAVSTDGGLTWTLSNEGMPETAATHILLDPTSPAGSRTLYVCGFGRGVFKSTDSGKTWALKNNGIDGKEPFAWRIIRADDGTLYLIVARRREDGGIGGENDGALYKSTDGAETWAKMPLPEGCNGPNGLALDPTNNRRMYLTVWGRAAGLNDLGGGVFLSEDGGQTWRCIFGGSQHAYDITVDPKDPKTLYLCGFDYAAFRSTDAGKTWSKIKGYNFKWGHRVVLDPVNPQMIYITTFGGSVWHGPAAGDPKALEDVVTPVPSADAAAR